MLSFSHYFVCMNLIVIVIIATIIIIIIIIIIINYLTRVTRMIFYESITAYTAAFLQSGSSYAGIRVISTV